MTAPAASSANPHSLMDRLLNPVAWLGDKVLTFVAAIGAVLLNGWWAVLWITRRRWGWGRTLEVATQIGIGSAPMALLICLIAGSVMALQVALRFVQTGANDYVGGLVSMAIIRELGPMFTALAVASRNGTAMAAEVGNMSVTEQLDALRMMGVSPIRYLLVPRFLAALVMVPVLTVLCSLVATLGGMGVAYNVAEIHPWTFIDSVWVMVTPYDIEMALVKSVVFGGLIALICTSLGLNTRGGAPAVGKTTRYAAIWTAVTLIIVDFILSLVMFGNRQVL